MDASEPSAQDTAMTPRTSRETPSQESYRKVVKAESLGSDAESLLLLSDEDMTSAKPKSRSARRRIKRKLIKSVKRTVKGSGLLSVNSLPSIPEGTCSVPVTASSKRARSSTGTTPDNTVKRVKSYAEVAADNIIKFAIFDRNSKNTLDEEKLNSFILTMEERILDAADNKLFLQMRGCTLIEGAFACKCVNEETLAWFRTEVVKLTNIWEGAQLAVGDLPKPIRVRVWIPGPPRNPKSVLENISRMNPEFVTRGWKIIASKSDPKGQTLVLQIDRKSLEELKLRRFTVQFTMDTINFKMISKVIDPSSSDTPNE